MFHDIALMIALSFVEAKLRVSRPPFIRTPFTRQVVHCPDEKIGLTTLLCQCQGQASSCLQHLQLPLPVAQWLCVSIRSLDSTGTSPMAKDFESWKTDSDCSTWVIWIQGTRSGIGNDCHHLRNADKIDKLRLMCQSMAPALAEAHSYGYHVDNVEARITVDRLTFEMEYHWDFGRSSLAKTCILEMSCHLELTPGWCNWS